MICSPILLPKSRKLLFQSFTTKPKDFTKVPVRNPLKENNTKKPQTALSTFPKYKGKFDNFEKVHMICSPILLPKSRKLLFQSFTTQPKDFGKVPVRNPLKENNTKKPQTALSTFPKYKGKFDNFEKVHMTCSLILLPKKPRTTFSKFYYRIDQDFNLI